MSTKSKWIDVEKEYPEPLMDRWIVVKDRSLDRPVTAKPIDGVWMVKPSMVWRQSKFTHWMPMPDEIE